MSLTDLSEGIRDVLEEYLPKKREKKPFVTLTYAQSLDSRIAAKPGQQTKISHLETKTMTHYIRSKHEAILAGVGTVLADDPKLNCRYKEVGVQNSSPRPIVLDPQARWDYSRSQLRQICDQGQGLAPYIIVDEGIDVDRRNLDILDRQNGAYVKLPLSKTSSRQENWDVILSKLWELGIGSVMIEGGATIINDLLSPKCSGLVDSVIITIGPVFLGREGVEVSPAKTGASLTNVRWWHGIQDSVLCARINL